MRWFFISVQTDSHHDIVISDLSSLTTLSWVSQFHKQSPTLTSWQLISYAISWKFKLQNIFEAVGFISKLDINK